MGTICAPSYPNNFMSKFEEKCIYPLIKNKSLIFLRYAVEIFIDRSKIKIFWIILERLVYQRFSVDLRINFQNCFISRVISHDNVILETQEVKMVS